MRSAYVVLVLVLLMAAVVLYAYVAKRRQNARMDRLRAAALREPTTLQDPSNVRVVPPSPTTVQEGSPESD